MPPPAVQPADPGPRIPPGTAREIGLVNTAITRLLGAATGGAPPNVFTTLARHRGLFRKWLLFAGGLMPGGTLPRAETELVILRVAHTTGCEYEWQHHERLARAAGLTATQLDDVRRLPDAARWSPRQRLLLRATDELSASGAISDAVWQELRPLASDVELIELCLLVGHYEMLAMTLASLGTEPDALPAGPPARTRLLRALTSGRRDKEPTP